jgi:3-hydroxyacyl-CoA dehydrogenase
MTMKAMHTAAVIGAGVMGSGIAAHLANAGLEVILLDMDRTLADAGIARQLKAGGFMDPDFAGRIRTGSVTEDIALIADADWIVEAVAEKLDIKQALYARIDQVRKTGGIVSSNTSTIPLQKLVEGMSDRFAADFLVTHFFNPPRVMRLLEIVSGAATRPDVTRAIRAFAERQLGKSVVDCKDTPGFIANRIGTYWMAVAFNEAVGLGMTVEEADAVIGKPFGVPATGIFGLLDLVGIDLMPLVLRSLQDSVPAGDAINAFAAEHPLMQQMIAAGRLGRKSAAGFYRLSQDRKSRHVIDLATGEYRAARDVASESLIAARGDPRALIAHDGIGGRYAAAVMGRTLAYAAALLPAIADRPETVDEAMRAGYGWKYGPFELIDRLGAGWLAAYLAAHGMAVPGYLALAAEKGAIYTVQDACRASLTADGALTPVPHKEGVLSLADLALAGPPVVQWESARLWDLGDGVACLDITTKMRTFSPPLLDAIGAALAYCAQHFSALVIGGDSAPFSAGADLRIFIEALGAGGPDALERFVETGQATFQAVKYAPFPVVAAASGIALGGGCELLLHCDSIQAHAELAMGLVETKVGLIPGWGGCKEMLARYSTAPGQIRGPVAPAIAAFDLIASARVSANAHDARKLRFLRPVDGITMNIEHLLADAKARALDLAAGYVPPEPPVAAPAGPSGASAIGNLTDSEQLAGRISAHDAVIRRALAMVLTGGASADPLRPMMEADISHLERQAFVALGATPQTVERINHMLATGRPLAN